jgi:uroporphyrin-III C-methyltransferase
MGVNTLPSLTAGLARFGMRAEMPVAIVERGFRPDQRTTIGDLADIVFAAGRAGVTSPAVVVIGEVVRLAHDGDASAAELMERAAAFAAVAS